MKDFIRNKVRETLITENRVKPKNPILIPNNIQTLKDVFKKNGHKLFLVGGAVRDAVLGVTPKDYDIATDAVPDEVERILADANIKSLPTGKENGVISAFLPVDGELEEYEIATFRKDVGTGRRPDSVEFTTIDQDVTRRDLTINALFYDMDTKEIVDLVGGIKDLKRGIIRAVGSPKDRFGDDRLRIQRAVRFQATLGGKMDPETEGALLDDASLEGISGERIRDEFLKGIKKAKSVKQFLELNDKFKLFDWIFPGLEISRDFINDRDPVVTIANLLKGNDVELVKKTLNKSTYSQNENKAITFLISLQQFKDVNQVFEFKKLHMKSGVSDTQILKFAMLAKLRPTNVIKAFIDFKLSVGGDDVAKLGVKPGPEMGQAIKQMEIDNFKKLVR